MKNKSPQPKLEHTSTTRSGSYMRQETMPKRNTKRGMLVPISSFRDQLNTGHLIARSLGSSPSYQSSLYAPQR